MFWLRLIYTRLYGLLRKNRIEQEMEDEMRFHLRMRTRENIARGMRPDEAEREARRRSGNLERIKDLARDIKGGGFMETILQDLRYGARMLLKNPGFTFVVVITAALGIGVNTSIFCLVDAALLRPLPVAKAPEELVELRRAEGGFSYPDFEVLRERSEALSGLALHSGTQISFGDGERSEVVRGSLVSANYFEVLG